MRGQPMKQVEEFTYLCSVVTSYGKCMLDIQRRRAGATRAFEMLRQRMSGRREIKLKMKMNEFYATVIPVLLHGLTVWSPTNTEEMRVYAFEMGKLMNTLGLYWDDFVRNKDIRDMLCQAPVSLNLRRVRMKGFENVERMGWSAR